MLKLKEQKWRRKKARTPFPLPRLSVEIFLRVFEFVGVEKYKWPLAYLMLLLLLLLLLLLHRFTPSMSS
jgi:hypothetical protein